MRFSIFFLLVASGYWLVPAPAVAQFNSFTRQELTLELTPVPNAGAAGITSGGSIGGDTFNLSSTSSGGSLGGDTFNSFFGAKPGDKCKVVATQNGQPIDLAAEGFAFEKRNFETGITYRLALDNAGSFNVPKKPEFAPFMASLKDRQGKVVASAPFVVGNNTEEQQATWEEFAQKNPEFLASYGYGTGASKDGASTTTVSTDLQKLNAEIDDLPKRLIGMGYDPSNPDEPYSDYARTLAEKLAKKEAEEKILRQQLKNSSEAALATLPKSALEKQASKARDTTRTKGMPAITNAQPTPSFLQTMSKSPLNILEAVGNLLRSWF